MEKITKKDACEQFIRLIYKEVNKDFPKFVSDMKKTYGDDFKFVSEDDYISTDLSAKLNFLVARVSVECYSLYSLFSETKTSLIIVTIMHAIKDIVGLELDYIRTELFTNLKLLEDNSMYFESDDPFRMHRPFEVIMERFLKKNLGENIHNFYLKKGKSEISQLMYRPEIINPMVSSQCAHHLLNYKISWSVFVKNFEII